MSDGVRRCCGAKTRAGGTCANPPMLNGRCRMHGGTQKRGVGHHLLKHGRYSLNLPTRLAARYAEAQADPDLISVRQEIALVDARLEDLLGRVDTGEAGAIWAGVRAAVDEYRKTSDAAEKAEAFARIESLSVEGFSDYASWGEVLELIERRRKLAETETKRLAAMGQAITAERAMVLLGTVVDIIRTHVTDRNALAAISHDLGRLVAQ